MDVTSPALAPRLQKRSGLRTVAKTPALAIEARNAMALKRRRKAVFVDLRDWEVLDRTGWIEGSLHCPAGEFASLIDPHSPLHARLFEPGVTFVFYGGPAQGPLAAARKARALGIHDAVALRGGLGAWQRAGGRMTGHPHSVLPVIKTSIALMFEQVVSDVRHFVARHRGGAVTHG